MLTFFLGAGFSKWAAGLPVVAELFDFNISPRNARDEARLRSFRQYKVKWDAVNAGAHPEVFIANALATPRYAPLVVWYLTRRLSESFIAPMLGGTQSLMIDDRRKFQISGVKQARSFLLGPPCPQAVITCNYDLLVEYALGSDSFHYGTPGEVLEGRGKNPWFPWHFTGVTLNGEVPLAKLHGSISWDKSKRYTDGRCGVKGSALIVPPAPEKTPPPMLIQTWRLAESLLSRTASLLVFGFAFNAYDVALLNLLRKAGAGIKSVLLVDPCPRIEAAQQIWPGAEIVSCPPPPAGSDTLIEWLGKHS